MAIAVRIADLKNDRSEIIRFLHRNLTERSNDSRFDWLYLRNPQGQAHVWMAVDDTSGRTIGVAAAFPREMWIGGKPQRVWVLGDFCISPEHRSLGPALLLQRACLNALTNQEDAICYDFPSLSMTAVYRRLGITPVGNHVRYVMLNRIDANVRARISNGAMAKGMTAMGNLALRAQRALRSVPRGLDVSAHDGAFGDEFTSLDSAAERTRGIWGMRTAEYLNWRYAQNPLNGYRVAVARREGKLCGYAIVEALESDWVLSDLQVVDEARTIPGLLIYLANLLQRFDVDKLSAPMMEGSPFVPYLRRAGFHGRDSVPFVACVRNGKGFAAVENGSSWYLMQSDRES